MAGWLPTSTAPPGAPPAAPPAGAPPAAQPASVPTLNHQFITLPDGTQAVGDLTKNADGSYTVSNGNYAGLQLDANRQAVPQSLAQVQAIQKAQSQPGGLTQQGFTYFPNPDGTLTITGPKTSPSGQPNIMVGAVLQKNGMYTKADGTPFPQGGVAGNPPQWAPRQPDGAPATSNPDFKGSKTDQLINAGINTVTDAITKDNPIAGQIRAGVDIANGNTGGVKNDLAQGFSGGTVGVDANGNLTPGSAVTDAGAIAAGAGLGLPSLPGFGSGTSGIDTSAADAETQRANALADALGVKADTAGVQANQDRALGTQTRGQQEQSIQDLQDAAAGRVASPAELQLKQQAGVDAARQYGLAAALQGGNPTAALRQASIGAATVAGKTNQDAAILRANETANARNSLATALANVRSADQGATNTDVSQQGTLTQGQLTSQGQGVTSTGQKLTAEAAKAQADAQKEGAELGAVGALGAGLLTKSDKRSKDDVRRANLADAIGKEVHGVTFEYKPGEGDRDPHFGVLAQEIERVIPGAVKPGTDGMKRVDAGHLTMGNTAVLAELARRIQDLEKKRAA